MPKFYFHLSNSEKCFRDNIGHDLADIGVAHTRAQRLANLVMTTSRLANHELDWRRWTVTVTHDPQGPILIIPFGAFGIVPPGPSRLVRQYRPRERCPRQHPFCRGSTTISRPLTRARTSELAQVMILPP